MQRIPQLVNFTQAVLDLADDISTNMHEQAAVAYLMGDKPLVWEDSDTYEQPGHWEPMLPRGTKHDLHAVYRAGRIIYALERGNVTDAEAQTAAYLLRLLFDKKDELQTHFDRLSSHARVLKWEIRDIKANARAAMAAVSKDAQPSND